MSTLRVISLGWGVQSFTLAAMAALGELESVDFAIHADTTWERSHTYEFAGRWAPWLEAHGVKVVTVSDPVAPHQLGDMANGQTYVPVFTLSANGDQGQLRRSCTDRWKIEPMHRYVKAQGATAKEPAEQWIGISKDEWHRAKDSDVRYIVHRFPLLERNMTRADCIAWLTAHCLEVPGKSACTFCPFHDQRAWQELKRLNGHDWAQAVEIDAAIRDKRPAYQLYVHRACKPLPEAVQIPEDFGLEQRSLFDAPCDSGYCFL